MSNTDIDLMRKVLAFLADQHEPRVAAQIAKDTGENVKAVRAMLNRLKETGQVASEGTGATARWRLDLESADTPAEPSEGTAGDDAAAEPTGPEHTEEPQGPEAAADTDPNQDGPDTAADADRTDAGPEDAPEADEDEIDEADEPAPEAEPEVWTTCGPIDRSSPRNTRIDLELSAVFNLLPAHDAAEGVPTGYIVDMLTDEVSALRVAKALFMFWQRGIAQASGPFRPDRGTWKLTPEAVKADLKRLAWVDAPTRATCPDCGHDAKLDYAPDAMVVQVESEPLNPDGEAPDGFEERPGDARSPEVMFCAMLLDHGDPMTVDDLAAFTGFPKYLVIRALWAMWVCRIVACTDHRRPDGGTWRATEATFVYAPLVSLGDAPVAMACNTCGNLVGVQGTPPSSGAVKKPKGDKEFAPADGGARVPVGGLGVMTEAWAHAAPAAWEVAPGKDPATHTPANLTKILLHACDTGDMVTWLTDWVKNHQDRQNLVDRTVAAISATDPRKQARPRSSGAVRNACAALAAANGSPIERVWDAPAETYRSRVKPAPEPTGDAADSSSPTDGDGPREDDTDVDTPTAAE